MKKIQIFTYISKNETSKRIIHSKIRNSNRFQTPFEIPHLALPYCILITSLVIISPLIPLLSRNESRSFNFNRVSKLQFSHEAKRAREQISRVISTHGYVSNIYIYIHNIHSIHIRNVSNYQVFSKTLEKIPWTMPGSITIEIRDGKSYPTGRMHPSEMHLNRA